MRATSNAQYSASASVQVPDLERVREGIWALPLPLPHGRTPYSFAYFVLDSDDRLHVIDPGSDSEDNWGAVRFAMKRMGFGRSDIASITVTHMHPDHIGMAARFHRAPDVRLQLHPLEQRAITAAVAGDEPDEVELFDSWSVPSERRLELEGVLPRGLANNPPPLADVLLDDGDRLDVPGRDIRVLHTPGHTTGTICLVLADEDLVFTGDHVLPEQHPGLGLGGRSATNPLADYLNSLERVAALGDLEALPGHGYRFVGLPERSRELAAHHRSRTDEIEGVLAADPDATVWQIASRLTWTGGWDNLHASYARSALAQTAMHVDYLQGVRT